MALKSKGTDRSKDSDEDGESPFMSLEEAMRKLKAGPLNFGVYQTGDRDNPVLIAAHKRKNPAVLGKQAKKEAGTTKGAFGRLTLDSGALNFECENDDPPASLKKKLRVMLKNAGFAKFKPRIVLPGGDELGGGGDENDDDDILDDAGAAGETATEGGGEKHAEAGNLSEARPQFEKIDKVSGKDKADETGEDTGGADAALKKEIEAKWEEAESVLVSLVDAGDSKVASQAAKLMSLMESTLKAGNYKKAKGAMVLVEKFIETALGDLGDADGGKGSKDNQDDGGEGSGHGGGGGAGGGAPSGGGAGGGSATAGGGAATGGGGVPDEEAAQKFKEQALMVSASASASAGVAGQAATAAGASASVAAAAATEAEAVATECEGKVGAERGMECRKEFDAAKSAAAAAATAQAAVAAAAKASSEASASANASANATASGQGVAATQTSADAAKQSMADASQLATAAARAEADAKAALDRCKAARDRAITEAETEKADALTGSQAVIDRMKSRVASAGTAPEGLAALVADLKSDAAEQEAIVPAASPNRGSIGDGQRSALETHAGQCQQIIEEGTDTVTGAARRMADEAKTMLDEKQAEYDKVSRAVDQCKQEADAAETSYGAAMEVGGKLVETAMGGLVGSIRTGLQMVSDHHAKAGEAIKEGQSGVSTLFATVSNASTGFLDIDTHGRLTNLIPQIGSVVGFANEASAQVGSALGNFDGAKVAALQAVEDETAKLINGAKEIAAPFISTLEKAGTLVGPIALAALDKARQGPASITSAFGPMLDKAVAYGGSAFVEAAQQMTAAQTQAQEACTATVAAIEATRERIKAEHQAKADEIKGRAEGKVAESKSLMDQIVASFSNATEVETGFEALTREIGKFADPVKPHIDALGTLRSTLKQDAEEAEGMFAKVSEAIDGLGAKVQALFEQILPDFGDDPVAPHEMALEEKVKAAEAKSKEIEAKQAEAKTTGEEARAKARDWLADLKAAVQAAVDPVKGIAGGAAGGIAGLTNDMIAQIKAKIEELEKKKAEADEVGGETGEQAAEEVDKGIEEAKEAEQVTLEAIQKAQELVKAELAAYRKTAAAHKASAEAVSRQATGAEADAKMLLADLEAKYGNAPMDDLESSGAKLTDALQKGKQAVADMDEVEKGSEEALNDLAKHLEDPELAGELIKAKDRLAELLAKGDRAHKALQEVPGEINAGLAELKRAAAKFPATFAQAAAELTATTRKAESLSSSQFKKAAALARKGDASTLETFLGTSDDVMTAANKRVSDCDEHGGGSEMDKLRVVLATSREQIKADYVEARMLLEEMAQEEKESQG